MKTNFLAIVITSFIISACSFSKVPRSNIDPQIQETVTVILREQLLEVKADSGLILVMDVKSGRILAKISMVQKDSTSYVLVSESVFNVSKEAGTIFQPISMMAALESGKISINDSVDVEHGRYTINGINVFDRNYDRGGYGKITREQAIVVSSNIGIYKTHEEVFGSNISHFSEQLGKMSVGEPTHEKKILIDTTLGNWVSLGTGIKLTPIQILTFYNAIANNGRMVYEDKILNPQIASASTIQSIQKVLSRVVSNGTGISAKSDRTFVAGKTGSARFQSGNPEDVQFNPFDVVSFCGYFPAENPRYTCLIEVYSPKGRIAMGGTIAAPIFRKVAEKLVE